MQPKSLELQFQVHEGYMIFFKDMKDELDNHIHTKSTSIYQEVMKQFKLTTDA